MSELPYTYQIATVDRDSRCMEVIYESPGRQTVRVSTRMPFVGETVEAVVAMFAPVRYWQEQDTPVIDVPAGGTGAFVPPGTQLTTLNTARQAKLAEIAAWRYSRETEGMMVGGARIKTDRESQATITGAYISLSQGLVQSIDWKAEGGVWIQLTINEVEPIARAVVAHVQASFTAERALVEQVMACETIEQVRAVIVPWATAAFNQIPATQL